MSRPADPATSEPVPAPSPSGAPAAVDATSDTTAAGRAPGEAWRADAGRGVLAPVLLDGGVLIATTTSGGIVALSAADGSKLWGYRVRAPKTGSGPGIATLAGDRVYLVTERPQPRLVALARDSGDRRWERWIGSTSLAPLVVGDTVFVASDAGVVVALDGANGDEIWRRPLDAAAAAAPVAYRGEIYVPTDRDALYRLSRATGAITGRVALPGNVSAPAARVGATLLLPFYTGDLVAVDLPSMTVRWRAALGSPILAAPAVAPDGRAYLLTTTAELWRANVDTGAVDTLAALGGAATGSLALAGDRLLVGRLDGTLFALRRDGTVAWRKPFTESIAAPAAVNDDAVYVPLLRGHIVKLK